MGLPQRIQPVFAEGGTRIGEATMAAHNEKNYSVFYRGVRAGAYTATGLQ